MTNVKKTCLTMLALMSIVTAAAVPASAAGNGLTESKNPASSKETTIIQNNIKSGNISTSQKLPNFSTFVAQHKIYGENSFTGLTSIGINTAHFNSDGNDVQVNSYASHDVGTASGTYYITLYKKNGIWPAINEGTASYATQTPSLTHFYIWTGVGTGEFWCDIHLGSGDPNKISGGITVYAQN